MKLSDGDGGCSCGLLAATARLWNGHEEVQHHLAAGDELPCLTCSSTLDGGSGTSSHAHTSALEDVNLQRLFTFTLVLETRDYSIIY